MKKKVKIQYLKLLTKKYYSTYSEIKKRKIDILLAE